MLKDGFDTGARTLLDEVDVYYLIEGLHSPLYIESKCCNKKPTLLNTLQKVLSF